MISTTNDELSILMKQDPVATAEKLTGQKVTTEPNLPGIFALQLSMEKGKRMKSLLAERGDVWSGMNVDDYRSVIEAHGFELVYSSSFAGNGGEERHFIYAHREGLLLSMDTYAGERVNGGKVYYCWRKGDILSEDDLPMKPGIHSLRACGLPDLPRGRGKAPPVELRAPMLGRRRRRDDFYCAPRSPNPARCAVPEGRWPATSIRRERRSTASAGL